MKRPTRWVKLGELIGGVLVVVVGLAVTVVAIAFAMIAFSLAVGNHFLAADHGPRSRQDVLDLALRQLLA